MRPGAASATGRDECTDWPEHKTDNSVRAPGAAQVQPWMNAPRDWPGTQNKPLNIRAARRGANHCPG
jgi:hypothetical protein